MKQFTLLLLLMLLAPQAFGQKKKDKEKAAAAQADSVARAMAADSLQKASNATELALYQAMYDTLKTKVFKYDFDPARTSVLVDSLVMKRESAFAGLNSTTASLMDSVSTLREENTKLRTQVDKMLAMEAGRSERSVLISELKDLKELLDEKILTQEEFNLMKKKQIEKL